VIPRKSRILYPNRDWKDNSYHEDHIFPKSEFTTAKLKARGYDLEKIIEYQKFFNTILNLQLLTDSENLDKNKTDFAIWISTRDDHFRTRHTLPYLNSYSFDNFLVFIQERQKQIIEKLESLAV
jgi:hypothetical protein